MTREGCARDDNVGGWLLGMTKRGIWLFFAEILATFGIIAYICHRKWEIFTITPKIINVMKKKFLWMMTAVIR